MSEIKICGIKNIDEIFIINKYPIRYAGFIFAESRRKVDIDTVNKITSYLREDILKVGVFMNQDLNIVNSTIKACDLDYVQLHGEETHEYCKNIIGAKVIKAITIDSKESINKAYIYSSDYLVLLDTKIDNIQGGTGIAFEWDYILEHNFDNGFILAGGINPDNIEKALQYNSLVIDVNSGVETNLIKDENKIKELFKRMENVI